MVCNLVLLFHPAKTRKKKKDAKMESLNQPALKRRAIVVCPFKGAFKVAQPFKAGMRNFVEFEPSRVFAMQKRSGAVRRMGRAV